MAQRFQLQTTSNSGCSKGCNKDTRRKTTQEDLCVVTSSNIDNLPIRCVGSWAPQKIYLITQYLGIFAHGMAKKWEGNINYIEICSGPGRCVDRSNGMEFDGTALSIIKNEYFKLLNRALFFDYNEKVVSTLNERIQKLNVNNAKAIVGDYYDAEAICATLKAEIPRRGLNLVLIDPTDCSVPFHLIEAIKRTMSNVDFVINMAIGTDFNRNIANILRAPASYAEVKNKYVKFLGNDYLFQKIDQSMSPQILRGYFRDEYQNSLRNIGYEHFRVHPIECYYDIIFASSHIRGLDFWDKATRLSYDGQASLF